jgi:hypothetical protein
VACVGDMAQPPRQEHGDVVSGPPARPRDPNPQCER